MERRAITVAGIVQGVGFRPFVLNLAGRLRLAGYVRNRSGTVQVEVEGPAAVLDAFIVSLVAEAPALAKIERVHWDRIEPTGEDAFHIRASVEEPDASVFISPDVATCADCLREVFDPADRRFRYPFTNCTNCGPRLTIVTGAPYDRGRTTMAPFAMCDACRAEYENPGDRRFHAQPIACPACGPRLRLLDADGNEQRNEDPLREFTNGILNGAIGALKGLGGFHLVCDARNASAVQRLRSHKHREDKPFAIMLRDVMSAEVFCDLSVGEAELLRSRAAPIVLLPRKDGSAIARAVAPGNPCLGVMLPSTPLHHLLAHGVGGIPLVMTSGNRSDEPIARDNEEAVAQLRGIAEMFLTHDRSIHVRCDDSVTRIVCGQEQPVRRSRGYTPQPIRLPFACAWPILAVGGQLKGTFALGRECHAFVSHHLGDLDHYAAHRAFVRDIALYRELFRFEPECIAHDLHPDYASTRHAVEFGGVPRIAVQHHHAHLASCMAENHLDGEVIGVTFDGTGLGTDGAVWGGEFLVGGYHRFRRAAHLRSVAMPGGEQAIREPWRMAVSHLRDAGCDPGNFASRVGSAALRTAERMIERGFNAPMTSSAGRLFDAVAAVAGGRDRMTFEGQAAMELEWLAAGRPAASSYPFDLIAGEEAGDATLVIDTRPLISAVASDARADAAPAEIARRFHSTLVEIIALVCDRIREHTGLRRVVLSGGVFMNVLLTTEATTRLTSSGFEVYRHRLVPPNDAGLSLGQIAVATHQLVKQGAS